ncbi:MAG: xanthine dehydrogenase family protein molybdopterin-binding subunit [Spirochaetia bacterium]
MLSNRKEISKILKGHPTQTKDHFVKGMLKAVNVRTEKAGYKISSIQLPDLPEGYFSVTASDIPGVNSISINNQEIPVLAEQKSAYPGEPIALICGEDVRILQKLARQVEISYAPDTRKNTGKKTIEKRVYKFGSPDKEFRNAYQIIEGEYNTGVQEHYYDIPHCVIALWNKASLEIYTETQCPSLLITAVSSTLDVSPDSIILHAMPFVSGLDGKTWFPAYIATHAALLSKKAGKPVFLEYTRLEDFCVSPKRAPVNIAHQTAINSDGKAIAQKIRITANTGAFCPFYDEILNRLAIHASGLYPLKNRIIEAEAIKTPELPKGECMGFGSSSAYFAAELHATRLAEMSQQNPVGWRLMYASGDQALSTPHPVSVKEIVEHAVEMSDFSRKHSSYELVRKRRKDSPSAIYHERGIGIAAAVEGYGLHGKREEESAYSVEIVLEKEGTVKIHTSTQPGNPDTKRFWKETASEVLGIEAEQIIVDPEEMLSEINTGPAILSRNITIIPDLIKKCCQSIKRKRFHTPLPIKAKRKFKYSAKHKWNEEGLEGTPYYASSTAACVVETEFDSALGNIFIRGIWACIDCGKVINKEKTRNAIETGIMQSIGWTMTERIQETPSGIPELQYYQYKIRHASEAPPMYIDFIESKKPRPPSGIDTLMHSTLPAALSAAIAQASGVYVDTLPVSLNQKEEGSES